MVNLFRTISKSYRSVNICDVCRSPGAIYVCQSVVSRDPYVLCNKQVCCECGFSGPGAVGFCLNHRPKDFTVGSVRVENIKKMPDCKNGHIPFGKDDDRYIYIGRRIWKGNWQLRESVFANQRLKKGATHIEKMKNLARYLGKLRYEIKTHGFIWADLHEMKSWLLSGRNIVLLCWCAPSTCHGDLVKKVLLELVEEACSKTNRQVL